MTGPDPAGQARLAAAAAALARPAVAPVRGRRPWWRRPRTVALVLAADLVVGTLVVRLVSAHEDSPAAAVTRLVALAARGDWAAVRSRLCSADQRQLSTDQVTQAGHLAALTLHGFDHAEVTAVTPTSLPVDLPVVGVVGLPVRQVAGRLIASLGPPSDFHVITVRELAGWRVCLSVGGYGSSALRVDVPIGGAAPALSSPDGG